MKPDITIYNATTARPVIFGLTRDGRSLLAGHYGLGKEEIDWVCIERVRTTGDRKFRELHGKIIRARIVVRNGQASAARLDELSGGAYSARTSSLRVA